MIPPILFLYWTGNEPPEEVVENAETYRVMNPGLDVRLTTDKDEATMLGYLRAVQEGTLIPLAELLPRISIPSCKADVMRVILLYLFGGIYIDCASTPMAPLSPLLEGAEKDMELGIALAAHDGTGDYSTRLLAGKKMADVLYRVLLKMQENLVQQLRLEEDQPHQHVEYNILVLTGTFPFYHVLGRRNAHGVAGITHIVEHDFVRPYGIRLRHHCAAHFETAHWSRRQRTERLFLEKSLS